MAAALLVAIPLPVSLRRPFRTVHLRASLVAPILVLLLAVAYTGFFSWLSVMRHLTLHSSAMDLGYTDQAVWNTLHGRFLAFSTYENATIDLPLGSFLHTDTLLAYHVELALAPISLLYLIYSSPVTLLVFQSAVLSMGAFPAYWLARRHLQSRFAGVTFALAYLLAPALHGANLSDFHAVSLTASLLLFAIYFLDTRRTALFLLTAVLAMSTKEDISLLVFMLGFYAFFVLGERRLGVVTMFLGLSWFLVCVRLILPHYSGLPVSPFVQRLAIFGETPRESFTNLLWNPGLLTDWLLKPEISGYLFGLLATGGFFSLLSPVALAGSPVLAMNVFNNWEWAHSEGAHYSASLVPFIIASSIFGVERLARVVSGRGWTLYPRAVLILCGIVLIVSGYHHYQTGISPLARSFYPPVVTAHHQAAVDLARSIPPGASLSTQSNLYPHLSQREKAYLFPAVNDAGYIFLDATTSSYPLTVEEVAQSVDDLLRSGDYAVLAAKDGLLLLKRDPSAGPVADLPEQFYSFARAGNEAIAYPLHARFGEELQLVGYSYDLLTEVNARSQPAVVRTYWQLLKPVDRGYSFPLFFTSRSDGSIQGIYEAGFPALAFYPLDRWMVGETVVMETPPLPVGRLSDVLQVVTPSGADPWSTASRLRVTPAIEGQQVDTRGEGTELRVFTFP